MAKVCPHARQPRGVRRTRVLSAQAAWIGALLSCASCYDSLTFGPAEPFVPGVRPAALAADREEQPPGRFVTFDLADPLMGHEANSNLFYSLNQLFGRLGDRSRVRNGLDKEFSGRLAVVAYSLYTAYGMRYYSHEIAHDYTERRHGYGEGFSLDFSDWSHGWPAYEMVHFGPGYWDVTTDEEIFMTYVHGLNQNEFNARQLWLRQNLHGRMDLQGSASFFLEKLRDLQYLRSTGLTDRRPASPLPSMFEAVTYINDNGLLSDVDDYVVCLMTSDVDLSKREYLTQVLIADLLSWQTWESIAVVGRYVSSGERATCPKAWNARGGLAITPPIISCYLTPRGTFYDAAVLVNPTGAQPVMVTIGTDVDSIGDGKVDRLRIGTQVFGLGRDWYSFAPFAYFNSSRADGYEGASLGVEAYLRLSPRARLRFKVDYSDGDVIENTVKEKEVGAGFVLGFDVVF